MNTFVENANAFTTRDKICIRRRKTGTNDLRKINSLITDFYHLGSVEKKHDPVLLDFIADTRSCKSEGNFV